jgi:hypothetical protein
VGKTWDAVKDFMNWLFYILPKPLKFFFFLYMILFLISIIMPKFLGAGFSCDSFGNPYKINFLELKATEEYVDQLASICNFNAEAEKPLTELPSFIDMVKNSLIKLWKGVTSIFIPSSYWKVYGAYALGDINTTQNELCDEYRSQVLSNQSLSRDFVLRNWGETVIQADYKQIVHIGCTQDDDGEWYQTLMFFNINIFDIKIWLLLGIIGIITPFMWKWYHWTLKR